MRLSNRIISLMLSIVMLVGLWSFSTVSAEANDIDVVGTGYSVNQENIVGWANYYYSITWTAKQNVRGWSYTFTQGNTYHIPYAQPWQHNGYIGFGISVDDFLAATNDVNSAFYKNGATYYGMDCTSFVSSCWGIARTTDLDGHDNTSVIGYVNSSTVNSLQIGDALESNQHAVLITDVIYNNGKVTSIEAMDASTSQSQLKKLTWSVDSFVNYYKNSFWIVRYNGNVPTPPNSHTDPIDYIEPPTACTLITSKNNYGLDDIIHFDFSSNVKIDYYSLQVWKGSDMVFSNETSSNYLDISAIELGSGEYAAYATCFNSSGWYQSGLFSFRIADRLTNPQIAINKNQFDITDEIIISSQADGGVDYYGLQIWKGELIVYQKEYTGHSISIPCSLLGAGDYAAFVSCVNASGSINTETKHFRIGYLLSNPQISISKTLFDCSETISINASAEGGADYYSVQIWNDNDLIYSKEFTGHTIEIPALDIGVGNYGVYISAMNAFGNVISETIRFRIIENCILGDADGDGFVTIMDATIIQRYLAAYTVKNPDTVVRCGDIAGDGLDIIDATLIQRFLAEFTVPYNIGQPTHR